MGKIIAIISVFSIMAAILLFAAAIQYCEERSAETAKLRRWERKVNQAYRENPDAVLGRV